jgi:hypothetical protein
MRNTSRRVSIVLFLSLAPIAALAATPNIAAACRNCVQYYQPFEHKQCDIAPAGFPGFVTCQIGPTLNDCTESGVCM